MYNEAPLIKFLHERFSQPKTPVRDVNLGIANLLNGTFVSFTEKFMGEHMPKILMASVAAPGIFSPVEIFESMWFSGSAVLKVDVVSPILRCYKKGYEFKDIVMDVILDDAEDIEKVDVSNYNALHMGLRTYQMMNHYKNTAGLLRARMNYPEVTFRHVIGSKLSTPFYKLVPIHYTPEQVKEQIAEGEKDALASIKSI